MTAQHSRARNPVYDFTGQMGLVTAPTSLSASPFRLAAALQLIEPFITDTALNSGKNV